MARGSTDTDQSLRDVVLAAWRAERSLDATDLDVEVDVGGCELRLTGDVGSYTDRLTALEVARRCIPEMCVRNGISVRSLSCDVSQSDDDLDRRVRAAMATVSATPVRTTVRDHVVRLEGVARDDGERRRLHAAVARTLGVHFVDDRLDPHDPTTDG